MQDDLPPLPFWQARSFWLTLLAVIAPINVTLVNPVLKAAIVAGSVRPSVYSAVVAAGIAFSWKQLLR